MVTISVIIPCHNDGAYLAAALDSVFEQSTPPTEVIVVDDGSTDDSAEVARRYGDQVRLVSQHNQGISAARNAGLAAATGDLIAFLDADDLWTRDSLGQRLVLMSGEAAADCVFGLAEQFLSPDLPAEEAARLHCPEGQTPVRFAGTLLIRRSVLDRVGGFDTSLRVGETIDLVARLTEDGAPTAMANHLVMRRRIHGNNTMIQQRQSQSDYLRVLKAAIARRAAKTQAGT